MTIPNCYRAEEAADGRMRWRGGRGGGKGGFKSKFKTSVYSAVWIKWTCEDTQETCSRSITLGWFASLLKQHLIIFAFWAHERDLLLLSLDVVMCHIRQFAFATAKIQSPPPPPPPPLPLPPVPPWRRRLIVLLEFSIISQDSGVVTPASNLHINFISSWRKSSPQSTIYCLNIILLLLFE